MSDNIKPVVTTLQVSKLGNTDDQNEDAFAVNKERCRYAVADGATESLYSREWAQILVKHFVQHGGEIASFLEVARQEWAGLEKPVPWYGEATLQKGSHATLMGLQLFPNGKWTATCVGDCYLLVYQKPSWAFYPPMKAHTNRPALISTQPNEAISPQEFTGSYQTGDRFYLMTDSLAEYVHSFAPNAPNYVEQLAKLTAVDKFATLLNQARQPRANPRCRDDDLTLVKVEINPK